MRWVENEKALYRLFEPSPLTDKVRLLGGLLASDDLVPFEGDVAWQVSLSDEVFEGQAESLADAAQDMYTMLNHLAKTAPSNAQVTLGITLPEEDK